ncbi:GNAT family N-acetyltransferase [Alkalicoccobacillus porphyridii]|uniref:GNAT family N-acetyltransferase n=1 Tax=Alkalicoccobacillus porphyridii TaxID=2597270 RepID=A0A553ZYU6_9BACI|nr:GNAT family N-acetyltransferase [Alkalicoccobacillus porphyridii]TSB46619.1 GNAT family N-acetyltransferase [Alkalicoccobacillus porphyridii]
MIRTYNQKDAEFVIQSHYELYSQEYGYDLSFKKFIEGNVHGLINRSRADENIWIVDIVGEPKGSIGLGSVDDETAQLGLFLVDPSLRGQGYGHQLIETCIKFCQDHAKKRIILYTNEELTAARHLYRMHGFSLKETWTSTKSNKALKEELWEKLLF